MNKHKSIPIISGTLIILGIGSCAVGANTHSGGDLEALMPLMFGFCSTVAGVGILTIDKILNITNRRDYSTEPFDENKNIKYVKRKLVIIFSIILFANIILFSKEIFATNDVLYIIVQTLKRSGKYAFLLFLIYKGYHWSRIAIVLLLVFEIFIGSISITRLLSEPHILIYLAALSFCLYLLLTDAMIRSHTERSAYDDDL